MRRPLSAVSSKRIASTCGTYVRHCQPPCGVGPAIAKSTYDVIRPGGAFLVYQFSAKAREFMARHFKRIDSGFEFWNVLPCQLFWGWKDRED